MNVASLDAEVPEAMDAAGDDPVERLAAVFRAYCVVVDPRERRERIKHLEVSTAAPLRTAIGAAVDRGDFRPVDVDLVAYDLPLIAHGRALEHWQSKPSLGLERYAATQSALFLNALVEPRHRRRYRRLVEPSC